MAKPKRICSILGCGKFCRGHGYCHAHYRRWVKYGDPLAGATYKGAVPAWCKEHASYSGDECLIWPFNRIGTNQRGIVNIGGRNIIASRYMCMVAHGEPPTPSHEAAHSCGKGHLACVNPRHLRWATAKENKADMVGHGTVLRGERNPGAKITAEEVLRIRSMHPANTHKDIARMFGVSRQQIGSIVNRKTWAHL